MQKNLNIELIRIIAMWLIVFGHIGVGYIPLGINGSPFFRDLMQRLCFFIPFHVNLFVLISGFCGIKSIRSSIIKLWVLLFSYLLLITIVDGFRGEESDLWSLFLPLSHNPWWFMRIYCLLSIVAPVMDVLLRNIDEPTWRKLLIVCLIVDLYAGFICQMQTVDYDGYNLIHFITIYLTGRYLSRFDIKQLSIGKYTLSKNHFLVCFFVIVIIKLGVHFILKYVGVEDRYMDYNNPFNYILSVCAFLYLLNLDVRQKGILFLSTSAVSVYLITCHPSIETFLMEKYDELLILFEGRIALEILFTLLFVSGLFIGCVIIDKVRLFAIRRLLLYSTLLKKL